MSVFSLDQFNYIEHLQLDNLLNASGVADVNSSFVLRAVKTDGGLPLPGA